MPISKVQKPHLNTSCSTCGTGKFVKTTHSGEWWLECSDCNSLLFCYNPMPHQARFHRDPHKIRLFAGGRKSVAALKRAKFGETLRAFAYDNPEPMPL